MGWLRMGIIRVTVRVIGVINLLTKSPSPSKFRGGAFEQVC